MWLDFVDWFYRRFRTPAAYDRYRENFIVNKVRTRWMFSGVIRGPNGVRTDAGVVSPSAMMNKREALKAFAEVNPNARVVHVDDRNKIITYES